MAMPPKGLRVKWCENLGRYSNSGKCHKLIDAPRDGWYIQVTRGGRWHALIDLRFARERDALRAVQSLTAAGLASHYALTKADPLTVKQVACEMLQW